MNCAADIGVPSACQNVVTAMCWIARAPALAGADVANPLVERGEFLRVEGFEPLDFGEEEGGAAWQPYTGARAKVTEDSRGSGRIVRADSRSALAPLVIHHGNVEACANETAAVR